MEWGVDGLARLAESHIVIVVDVLRFSSQGIDAVEREGDFIPDAATDPASANGAVVAEAAERAAEVVFLGGFRNAAAVADAVLAVQTERGERTSIAVIAAGEPASSGPGAGLRFAVEDFLGAGAVIAALGDLGIDYTSPEAAVAGEAFRALRGATSHMLTASGSGQLATHKDEVVAAAKLNVSSTVPVLRDGTFVAY